MTEKAARMPSEKVNEVLRGGDRAADEVAEARILGPNKSPQRAQNDDRSDDIAAPDMERVRRSALLLGGQKSNRERNDEGPVPVPNDRVPDR